MEVEVYAGVEVVGLGFGLPLDCADDSVVVFDDEGVDIGLREVVGHRRCHVVAATPPSMHLFSGPDPCQLWHISVGGWTQGHLCALQCGHLDLPCALCGA